MALDAAQLQLDLAAVGAAGMAATDLDRPYAAPEPGSVIRVGVSRQAAGEALDRFDILLTTASAPLRPWVAVDDLDAALGRLSARITAQPVAAAVAAQVLRMTLQLGFDEALALESLAYSMLLASDGFRAWRAATPPRDRPEAPGARVAIAVGEAIGIRLTRPARRNAFDARMRDELVEALEFAAAHPDAPPVVLTGEGPSFSAGGDLDEFGSAADVGWAHLIRTARSPARLVHGLGDRLTARLHGACVGAGIEVSAAAAQVTAQPGAVFRLPEVSMGLIPGAGGTASIPRRIGRQRACFMAIMGGDIDLDTALAWGLIDAIEPAS
ncbi:MAG TPA: enoyl-CoA hydratase/isomerase family protein [Caulobacteraceae bacterium]|nr:enoyl-CoA hydratase/isomerase family protein [Caulobacteraceae bacterium]